MEGENEQNTNREERFTDEQIRQANIGHNIVRHDMDFIKPHISEDITAKYIDTLYLSSLFFPKRPYHALQKDDKL